MSYELKFTSTALQDIEFHKKSGNKALLEKIYQLLLELCEHPTTRTGKPERLKYNQTNCWSRKINDKHRLVYIIEQELVAIIIIQTKGHYFDK